MSGISDAKVSGVLFGVVQSKEQNTKGYSLFIELRRETGTVGALDSSVVGYITLDVSKDEFDLFSPERKIFFANQIFGGPAFLREESRRDHA